METFLSAIVSGLVFGAPYSLLALGLVLVYKGSKVFNFAQGEFGTVAAFAVYLLQFHLPLWLATVLGLVVAVAMGLLVERFVVQPLFHAPRVTLLVATAAIASCAIALQLALGDATLRSYPPLVDGSFQLFAVAIQWQQLLVIGALGVLVAILYVFFNRTDLGLAVLAASQEPTATNLVGISVRRISALVWAMAAFLGGMAGVLTASVQPFTPGNVTSSYLVFAFVGAVIGGMTSMPGAVLGGLLVGLVQSFSANYLQDLSVVADNVTAPEQVALFVVLVGVLALKPTGLLGREA